MVSPSIKAELKFADEKTSVTLVATVIPAISITVPVSALPSSRLFSGKGNGPV
jgi:hypothetical protein